MEDTITLSEENENTLPVPPTETAVPNQMRLTDIEITDENMALNVIVSFLGVAQQRGTFSIAESAKIYECIQKFINKTNDTNA
jgi:hypothetical protein